MLARHRTWLLLSAVVVLGAAVRLPALLQASFPLGDGALWAAMVDDLRAAHYLLPQETTFNGGGIPFVYPPLAFYLAAVAVDMFRLTTLSALRWLPFAANLLTSLAVAWFAFGLTRSRATAVWAAAVFVLLPNSFAWLMMGGGLTRSLGLLLAVIALASFQSMLRKPGLRRSVAAGVAIGAASLTHPENIVFLALSLPLLWLSSGSVRASLARVATAAAVAGAVVAPWAITMLLRHGVEPFLGASTSSAWSLRGHLEFLRFEITGEPWIGVFSALALVGCFAAIARRQPVLPIWLFALYQFVPRSAGTYAQVLVALLAAIALVDVVIPGLERLAGSGNGSSPPRSALLGSRAATWGFAGALVLYGFVADLAWLGNPSCPLRAVDVEQRQAFKRVADAVAPGSAFVVVTGVGEWHRDIEAEWYPYLTGFTSATTVQGSEWLPRGGFSRRIELHFEAWAMAAHRPMDFERWLRRRLPNVDHVFLAGCRTRPVVAGVFRALSRSPTCVQEMTGSDSASFRLIAPSASPQQAPSLERKGS